MPPISQADRLLAYLRANPGATTMELQYGLHPFVSNPRARISDLRARGIQIDCRIRQSDGESGFYVIDKAQLELALA